MFRNRRFKIHHPVPSNIMVRVEKSTVTKDGIKVSSLVTVPVSEEHEPIPSPSDYKLSELLQAGVSLTPVNAAVIDNGPSDEQVNKLGEFLDKQNQPKIDKPDETPKD